MDRSSASDSEPEWWTHTLDYETLNLNERSLLQRINGMHTKHTYSRPSTPHPDESPPPNDTRQLSSSPVHQPVWFTWPSQMSEQHNVNWFIVPFFYLSLGCYLSLPSLAIQYYAVNVLRIGPSLMGLLTGVVMSPWFMKPLFGLVSDSVPIYALHRKPYLVFGSAGAWFVWLVLSFPGAHSTYAVPFGLLQFASNFFICVCDVMVDCTLAREARDEPASRRGRAQSMAWFMRHVGSLAGSLLGAYLVRRTDNLHLIFFYTSCVPLVLCFASVWLYEQPSGKDDLGTIVAVDSLDQVNAPASLLRRLSKARADIVHRLSATLDEQRSNPTIVHLAAFIFLFTATPNSSQAFFYFLVNELSFDTRVMGMLSVVGVVSAMLGLAVYRLLAPRVHMHTLLKSSVVFGTVLGLVQLLLITRVNVRLGISDYWFSLSDDVISSFVAQLTMMPLLVIAATVCPRGDEGLLYAGLMSISNFGGAVSTWFGSLLTYATGVTATNFRHLWLLSVLCSCLNLIPLAFVRWLPHDSTDSRLPFGTPFKSYE